MFQLSVVDHIRLTFGDVVCSYRAHTNAAEKLARRAWQMKTTVLALLGVGVIACTAAIVLTARAFPIVAAVTVGLAFLGYAASLALDFDPRVYAHRACAAKFWLLCEKYRALLTEIQDGVLQPQEVRARRDALIREAHSVYEQAPLADRDAYRLAKRALSPTEAHTMSDAEIDRFLPQSVQRGNPTPA
jgi:conflict system pore-forming effector with SLATT domain